MPCYHPWSKDGVTLACGQCRGCRASHAREWAMRCMHEAAMHEENCFVTLTYDNENLPPHGSLDREAFPKFIRSIRKRIAPQKVRYFHVGEYGTDRDRPHYHALLFGFDPSDKALLAVRGDFSVYTSELLRAAWPSGLHEVGSVTPQSAAYLSGYVKRKITGSWAKARYGDRVPEYGTMSRNPGIGAGWIDKFRCEVYPSDGVVVRGSIQKPPRYYDLRVERDAPALVEGVRLKRFQSRKREEETVDRMAAREACAIAQDSFNESRSL